MELSNVLCASPAVREHVTVPTLYITATAYADCRQTNYVLTRKYRGAIKLILPKFAFHHTTHTCPCDKHLTNSILTE